MKLAGIATLLAAAALCGCTTATPKPPGPAQREAALCRDLQSVLAQQRTGFSGLRAGTADGSAAGVWSAPEQLLGNKCQVWSLGDGSYGYICSVPTPRRELALAGYRRAREFTSRCLGKAWNVLESVGQADNAHEAVFSRLGSKTVVAVRAVPVRGVIASQWSTWYYVGDRTYLQ